MCPEPAAFFIDSGTLAGTERHSSGKYPDKSRTRNLGNWARKLRMR
jgi:hypothetical protein